MQRKQIAVGVVSVLLVMAMGMAVAGRADQHIQANDCAAMQSVANSGDVDAQYTLGMMYKQGKGCSRDPVMSFFWLHLAARAGYGAAFPHAGEISELIEPKTLVRIGKAEDEFVACQRARRPCDPITPLRAEMYMESVLRL